MDVEVSLERRAAVHAALGDAGRLAIVDALAVGDLTPGELAERLDVGSNLLAHHLRVLEEVGLVRRRRSEGDRRRSYVTLTDAASVVSSPTAQPKASQHDISRVVFVCSRNSARSQLAAGLWRRWSPFPVTSAGTHPAERVHPGALAVARRHGVTLHAPTTRHVAAVIRPGDLVVAVCDQAHEELPDDDRLHWSIPDPVREASDQAFDAVVADLTSRVPRLAGQVVHTEHPAHATHPTRRRTS
ncbi:protein-tyrosine-phosphatase [Haloactinopolyspora alba]|uniref:Protein-tyrosine-phosphatase n=1 Tax=Haloactinopolyspora alba TaxID=648780 RepID=A0A2P8E9E5_9ACTN|nr:helix-turn-helix domain-containing protein [Haloactinopolyspora alba]PSL06099.1 protein-tyrosine-phosphatase [Haloactinopolyspora alba]